jgi:signal peptidase I
MVAFYPPAAGVTRERFAARRAEGLGPQARTAGYDVGRREPGDVMSDRPGSTLANAPPASGTPTGNQVQAKRRRRRSWYRDVPILIVAAILAALLIKTFLIQAFYIPSPSMHPTLIENDRVLVNRMAYRSHEPRRGDVIVFENPHPAPIHRSPLAAFVHWLGEGVGLSHDGRNRDFIKRVIGLPGDLVEIHRGAVFVNGTKLPEPYLSPKRDLASYGPYHVPADNLFVLGDNRTDSDDSRGSLGYIPMRKVLGRAFVIVWPPSRWGWIRGQDYGTVRAPGPSSS